ncbi:MAG: hypothetical protein OEM59_19635, partial [Rhodospirillales bacterium]|nr:hypothetical protein [Rhodospirillales bacterium]
MKAYEAEHYLLEIRLLREAVESFDVHPFSLPAFHGLDVLKFHPAVTFLIGENGSGKSTLLGPLPDRRAGRRARRRGPQGAGLRRAGRGGGHLRASR